MNKMLIWAVGALSLLSVSQANAATDATPYLDVSNSFLEIKDVNRQAEAWAMCAATYDYMAGILSDTQPARSKQLSELANGAEVAVTMAIVSDGLDSEISQDRFNALWSMAKLSGTELPKTRFTMLAAEAEADTGNNAVFLKNLTATLEVCIRNLEGQQMYIDTWRELAKSGLLQIPIE